MRLSSPARKSSSTHLWRKSGKPNLISRIGQPGITTAPLEGDLKAGATFRWKAQGLNITSQLHTVEPHHCIGWTGTAPGMYAIHNWKFEARGNTTLAVTEESLSGWLTRLMKFFDPLFLEKSLEATLQRLKNKSEEK